MNIEEFNYTLPEELIAQHPTDKRSDSRLLQLNPNTEEIIDNNFTNFLSLINRNDLLIFNDTKVIKARIHGHKKSGGKVEVLIEKIINQNSFVGHIGTSKKINAGLEIMVGNFKLTVKDRDENMFIIKTNDDIFNIIDCHGKLPLPPYINRDNEDFDDDRYQTVFAKHDGAIAAPTAGLHFDDQFFLELSKQNFNFSFITLHVGSGTFQPVRNSNITDHKMHSEEFMISQDVYDRIEQTKKNGGRIVAIGTTVLRALESAYNQPKKDTSFQKTNIFIYPGYQFKIVDSLFTNFHLPKSTLIMLVSAFAGHSFTMTSYAHAVKEKYRFFSYGDAMFIEQKLTSEDKRET